jgi:acetyl-CoA C-acetyltransferase
LSSRDGNHFSRTSRAGDTVISIDEGPGNARQIATLRPAFKKAGTITAASSSSINDGAALLARTAKEMAQHCCPALPSRHCRQTPRGFTTAPP